MAYTDADVELVADVLWRYPSKTTTRAAATSVLDALVAAGWAPRAVVAEDIAKTIEERCAGSHLDLGDGPPDDCEHQRYAALARAHGEAGHG
jgi:hypothetical protein